MMKLDRLSGLTASAVLRFERASAFVSRPYHASDHDGNVACRLLPGRFCFQRRRRPPRPRGSALADLCVSDLLQQHTDRPREDLPDVPIRYRMAKQGAKLLKLCVDLLVGCKADRIPLRAQRFGAGPDVGVGVGVAIRVGAGANPGIGFTGRRISGGDRQSIVEPLGSSYGAQPPTILRPSLSTNAARSSKQRRDEAHPARSPPPRRGIFAPRAPLRSTCRPRFLRSAIPSHNNRTSMNDPVRDTTAALLLHPDARGGQLQQHDRALPISPNRPGVERYKDRRIVT